MKKSARYVAPWLAAFAIGGAVALAPIASAATHPAPVTSLAAPAAPGGGPDPLVPYGPNPQVQYPLGYIDSNHDEANTSAGQVDLPF